MGADPFCCFEAWDRGDNPFPCIVEAASRLFKTSEVHPPVFSAVLEEATVCRAESGVC